MRIKNKQDIINFITTHKSELANYGVVKLGIFGSFLHGKNNKDSDIDFIVVFNKDSKNYDNFINLAYYLEDSLDHKVDLLTNESLSPYIGPKIQNEVEYIDLSA